ncbi:MAG: hypothetical protein KDI68_14955 [Gammaproteobacteria bacterium]|nr:hypothetical protein [Gammaproteobacteria bacterium]
MKTERSRESFDARKRYSGVYQQMGRMFTDADWNELGDLQKHRLAQALSEAIGSGTPRARGCVEVTDNADGSRSFRLVWGEACVDGVIGEVRPDPTATLADPNGELLEYQHQADFPDAPAPTGDHLLYLDLWERSVTSLEDADLRDPGLQGADTCSRSQTMAQVKWSPLAVDPEDPLQNPPIGSALLSLDFRAAGSDPDPCDPCADLISLPDQIGNYLFRVEVHAVAYDPAGLPTHLFLKWSRENGAEQYPIGEEPPGFAGDDWSFEFFSGATEAFASEKHLGRHLPPGFVPTAGVVSKGYPETVPAGQSLVRRWDGFAMLLKSGADWTLVDGSDRGVDLSTALAADAHAHVGEGASITINLDLLTLQMVLQDHPLLAGDYWVREVRQAADTTLPLIDAEPPRGIRHHYMTLGSVIGGVFNAYDGDQCRRLGFPPLTDIRARDVCYAPPRCDAEEAGRPSVLSLLNEKIPDALLPPGASGSDVRTALNRLLCDQDAATLPIAKQNGLCPTLMDPAVRTVQDALAVLCLNMVEKCPTLTVFPDPGWERVFDRIPAGGDAHICFTDGEYVTAETVDVSNKGDLKITGAGPGTRIVASSREAAIRFSGCRSVSVRDIHAEARRVGSSGNLKALNGALTFDACGSVELSDCTLRCAASTRTAATCLTITNAPTKPGQARISGCRLQVGHRQIGMLLMNLERTTVRDNHVKTLPKPKSLTLERMLNDRQFAGMARKQLINQVEVRNFESPRAAGKKNIHMENNSNRRIMINSQVPANAWKEALVDEVGSGSIASNQALLGISRRLADRLLTDANLRARYSPFVNWFADLRTQNPAVSFKGIVCAGVVAKDVRIVNNTLDGVQEGIHIGVSDRSAGASQPHKAGRVIIEGNTINVQLPPVMVHRRGGIYVGNCNFATIRDNQIQVQRYPWSKSKPIEGMRIYGSLGLMMVVKQNYMTNCSVGVRFVALDASGDRQQWLIADNMMPGTRPLIATNVPALVIDRNNRG